MDQGEIGLVTVHGTVVINGGTITLKTSHDCIDVNGNLTITNGAIYASQPSIEGDVLDYDATLSMTGGEVYVDNVKYTKDTINNLRSSRNAI